MAISLRELDAELQKVVAVTTTEVEEDDDPDYPQLKGQFVFRDGDGRKFMWGPRPVRYEFHNVQTVAEADQLLFLCPKCFAANGGATGTHSVLVSFAGRNQPDGVCSRDSEGSPSRWTVHSGNSLDDLVLTPSIALDVKRKPEEGCHWHGFVGSNGIPPGHAG